jgi:hypothetical protein
LFVYAATLNARSALGNKQIATLGPALRAGRRGREPEFIAR